MTRTEPLAGRLPLRGIEVLEVATTLPGPYCGFLLSRLGARVVKLEPPWGDPLRVAMPAMFRAYNSGKESIAVDLKHPAASELVSGLVRNADVVVEGFRPGVAARLGLDYEVLRQVNPRIVYCSLSGFGQEGERRFRPGHDATYAAVAGLLLPVSQQGGDPRMSPVPIGDLATGLMAALFAVTSLLQRGRTGPGRYWDVSITDVLLSWAVSRGAEVLTGGEPPLAAEQEPPTHGLYRTRDGRYVALGAIEDHYWVALCELLSRKEWMSNPDLATNRGRAEASWLADELAAEFAKNDADEWIRQAEGVGLPLEIVRRLDDALRDPMFAERGIISNSEEGVDVGLPTITTPPLGSEVFSAAPGLGGDTDAVLAHLGYPADAIAAWRSVGLLLGHAP